MGKQAILSSFCFEQDPISSPGVKFSVQLLEPFLGNMGVNLSGGDIRMAEHQLYGPQVGAAFQ
jgi:hypothetical protein